MHGLITLGGACTQERPRSVAPRPITVVMNAGAGDTDQAAARKAIESAFARAGRVVRVLLAGDSEELAGLIARAADEARRLGGVLVAAGGDGTINSVAGAAIELGLPLGVVPLGTFNYFAREHRIPLEVEAACAVIAAGHVARVTVGRINGRPFLVNASVGLYARLIERREDDKQRFGRYRIVAVLSGLAALLRHHRTYEVGMDIDGEPRQLKTMMMFFGRNALQLESLGLDVARCVRRDELAVLLLRPVGRWELIGLALRGALQGLRDAPNLRGHCARRVEGRWRGARRVRVALDGEVFDTQLPLTVEAMPGALSLVVPGGGS